MAGQNCHYCTRPAIEECPTCGRLYCAEHGEDVCLRCLSPEAATPSAAVYRGAVLALVVGSLLAIFLVVSPPESGGEDDTVRFITTPTPSFSATATPTPTGGTGSTPSPAATPTGQTTATATVTASATGATTYTIAGGDTPSGLAERFGVTEDELRALNPDLDSRMFPGEVINVPPQAP